MVEVAIFHIPPLFDAPVRVVPVGILPQRILYGKTSQVALLDGEKFENMFTLFDTIHERYKQTDKRTDTARRHRLHYAYGVARQK